MPLTALNFYLRDGKREPESERAENLITKTDSENFHCRFWSRFAFISFGLLFGFSVNAKEAFASLELNI
jgi:hypothetical protein